MSSGLELIRDMIKLVQHAMQENSFTENCSEQIEKQLMRDFGGQEIYLPKADSEARRLAILQEFNGANRKELCAKYGICKAQFYNMLKGG